MREAIEAVIKDLNKMRKNHRIESYKDVSVSTSAYHDGVCIGLLMSIEKLKEVLAEHDPISDTSKPDGTRSAEQI